MSVVEEAECFSVLGALVEDPPTAFDIGTEVVESGSSGDAAMSAGAMGSAVWEITGVEKADERRTGHADELDRSLCREFGK